MAYDGISLLDRDGIAALGRAVIIDEDQYSLDPDGELADQPVVRMLVAEHPAAAVDIDNRRQRARSTGGPHDADVGRPSGADCERAVLDIGGR